MKRIAAAWTIAVIGLSVFLLFTELASSQGISTKTISPKTAIKITLSESTSTTILFPNQFTGVYGLGLVFKDKDTKGKLSGTVQGYYTSTKPVLVLRALVGDLKTYMTVFMDDQLYTFELIVGDAPDVAVTLRLGNNYSSEKAENVKPEIVVKNRPVFDPELLADLMDRADVSELLQASFPDGYRNYSKRVSEYVSDDGYVRTTVKQIHRFGKEDAIVLLGEARNLTSDPVKFDLGHVTAAIGDTQRGLTLLLPIRPIPGNGVVQFKALIMGDKDGLRESLSLDNEYRLIVDTGHARIEVSKPRVVLPMIPLLPPKKDNKP